MFFPKEIEMSARLQTTEPVLWTWPKPSSSSSLFLMLLIHLTEKRQHSPGLVSSLYSKFFLHKEKVRLGEVAKPAVDAEHKYYPNKERNFHLLQLHGVR